MNSRTMGERGSTLLDSVELSACALASPRTSIDRVFCALRKSDLGRKECGGASRCAGESPGRSATVQADPLRACVVAALRPSCCTDAAQLSPVRHDAANQPSLPSRRRRTTVSNATQCSQFCGYRASMCTTTAAQLTIARDHWLLKDVSTVTQPPDRPHNCAYCGFRWLLEKKNPHLPGRQMRVEWGRRGSGLVRSVEEGQAYTGTSTEPR